MLSGRFRSRWSGVKSAPNTPRTPALKSQESNNFDHETPALWTRNKGSDPCIAPNPKVVDLCYEIVEDIISEASSSLPVSSMTVSESQDPVTPVKRTSRKTATPHESPLSGASVPKRSPSTAWEQLHPSAESEKTLSFPLPYPGQQKESFSIPFVELCDPVQSVLEMLPIVPQTITPLEKPTLNLEKVDDNTVDFRIVHSFRAHFSSSALDEAIFLPSTRAQVELLDYEGWDSVNYDDGASYPDDSSSRDDDMCKLMMMRDPRLCQAPGESASSSVASSSASAFRQRLTRHRRVRSEGGGGVGTNFSPAPVPLRNNPQSSILSRGAVKEGDSLFTLQNVSPSSITALPNSGDGRIERGGIGILRGGEETARSTKHKRGASDGGRSLLETCQGAPEAELSKQDTGGWREAWDRLMQQEEESVPEICSPRVEALVPGPFAQSEHSEVSLVGELPGSEGGSALELLRRNSTESWEVDPQEITYGHRLAVGGFAEVFKAEWQGTTVAVKRLLESDSHTVERLKTEVKVLARLRHPNLLLFMGYHCSPAMIVSEYMKKGSLHQYLRKKQESSTSGLDLPRQKAVLLSVAKGMNYLHTRNPPILHLDLKSPNILIDDKWRVKIADFGLSKMRQRTFVSASSGGGGTPEWMAPEVLRSERYDERADVYSFGVVLWETLTGRSPWDHLNNPLQVVYAVGVEKKVLPTPEMGNPILLQLFRDCCAHEPVNRPLFNDIVKRLEEWDK